MTTSMAPPPPPPPSTATTTTSNSSTLPPPSLPKPQSSSPPPPQPSMGPPPPKIPNPEPKPQPQPSPKEKQPSNNNNNISIPYTIPEWSRAPQHPFSLEVLKDGSIVDNLDIAKKGAYMFGRIELCDFVLEHPTISRFHAVIQFKANGKAYLYDLGSTHGTSINKKKVTGKEYIELHVGDVIRFGQSSRLYIFQGPEDLMPPEVHSASNSYAKDREASLRRAREGAALADGISWGMMEDAIEEDEDDVEEITWQSYKGDLTEKQQKTREKVLKRTEKIAHMKKEIAAIRAKDIAQGGLTQGQQTQIARNEMRIAQLMEELESLEETLNDSIKESLGARSGRSYGRKKGPTEDEEELLSDDDDFYDRTKKAAKRSADKQSVETADSLLDKKETLVEQMDEKRLLLVEEKNKMPETVAEQDAGDELDAFMSGLSSQLVLDRSKQLENDLSALQTELDRVVYLLKIADPTGEAAKKRAIAVQEMKSNEGRSSKSDDKKPEKELKIVCHAEKSVDRPISMEEVPEASEEAKKVLMVNEEAREEPIVTEEGNEAPEANVDGDSSDSKATVYTVVKPQWLGAVEDRIREESEQGNTLDTDEGDPDGFVDYRDRKRILDSSKSQPGVTLEAELENAAPGLILRKKKRVDRTENSENEPSKSSSSDPSGTDTSAEDVVALLLKHKRGLYAADEEAVPENHDSGKKKESGHDVKRPRRVLGPEKPAFLESKTDYETWVPPKGQSGDGRTSLNDRLGY